MYTINDNHCSYLIYILFKVSDEIELLDYETNNDKSWPVYTDCESVHMRSTMFKTPFGMSWNSFKSQLEFITIDTTDNSDTTKYSGTRQIDIILSTNFTVSYHSILDRGDYIHYNGNTEKVFLLQWSCTEWGEWTPTNDGTCRHVIRPLHNGTRTKGALKYKRNETCSK